MLVTADRFVNNHYFDFSQTDWLEPSVMEGTKSSHGKFQSGMFIENNNNMYSSCSFYLPFLIYMVISAIQVRTTFSD